MSRSHGGLIGLLALWEALWLPGEQNLSRLQLDSEKTMKGEAHQL